MRIVPTVLEPKRFASLMGCSLFGRLRRFEPTRSPPQERKPARNLGFPISWHFFDGIPSIIRTEQGNSVDFHLTAIVVVRVGTGEVPVRGTWRLVKSLLGWAQTSRWMFTTALSVLPSGVSGWWIHQTGGSWLGSALAAVGAFVVVFLVTITIVFATVSFRDRNRSRLVPMHEIVAHVADRIADHDKAKLWPRARRTIRQAALDGQVQIYGHTCEDTENSNGTSWSLVSTPVPQKYWELADITEVATSPQYAEELMHHTRPHRLSDGRFTQQKIIYYAKLTAKARDVKRTWP
jgi:hypothetical protein